MATKLTATEIHDGPLPVRSRPRVCGQASRSPRADPGYAVVRTKGLAWFRSEHDDTLAAPPDRPDLPSWARLGDELAHA
jgi:hypothetical protein